jgi:hypothetical protein
VSEPLLKHRKTRDGIRTGAYAEFRDKPGGCPFTGQAVSGVKVARAWSAASAWNVGKRVPITRRRAWKGAGRQEGARRAAETVRC